MSWIITLPLSVILLVFAIANREIVTISLWPLAFAPRLPLFLLVLGAVFIGLLFGGMAAWLSGADTRRRARAARHRIAELERGLAELRRERDARGDRTGSGSTDDRPRLTAIGG